MMFFILNMIGFLTELKRRWEDLTDSRVSKSVGPFDFSVMSYNILSQELLLSNPYLYKHCHPRVLEWRHRFPNLIQELELHTADVRKLLSCTFTGSRFINLHCVVKMCLSP